MSQAVGSVVILNGAPRSGKSTIAKAMQQDLQAPWLNIGVDAMMQNILPSRLLPGLGLRPGGERPDLEASIEAQYLALYGAVAAFAEQGFCVAVDVGHHDSYSRSLGLLGRCCARIAHLPALLVGVQCSLDEVLRRRRLVPDVYESAAPGATAPLPVQQWQDAVHDPGHYDLVLDTGQMAAEACVVEIARALKTVRVGAGVVAQLAR